MRKYLGQVTRKEEIRMTEHVRRAENESEENDSVTVETKPIGAAVDSAALEGKRYSVRIDSESRHD